MEQEQSLGHRIKAARKKRGWSREKLAEEIGSTEQTVYRWETNKSFPRGDEIQLALIAMLSLPKDEFTKRRAVHMEQEDVHSSAQEVEQETMLSPVTPILPHAHLRLPFPSEEELSENGVVEYKILPVIVYQGYEEHTENGWYQMVTANGKRLLPFDTWLKVDRIIYGWGYTGHGPRHLAASMLLDYFEKRYPEEDEEVLRTWAFKYSYNFKMDFVSWFPKKRWEIWSGAITAWLKEQQKMSDEELMNAFDVIPHDWVGWSKRWDKYIGT